MRPSFSLASATALSAALAAGVLGCQTYDFEPVQPLAIAAETKTVAVFGRGAKPNVMLLVDTSGSMNDPAGTGRTRWQELVAAMDSFLPANGGIVRFGLARYPEFVSGVPATQCNSTSAVLETLPEGEEATVLQAKATAVRTQIQNLTRGGGTPTAASLRFFLGRDELKDTTRKNIVVLLTDGLPNCAPPDTAALDSAGSIQAVKDLKAAGVDTIVIGFGAATADQGALTTLNGMALEGGYARGCNAGDTNCRRFYQAGTEAELNQVLESIVDVVVGEVCFLKLESPPSDPRLIVVYVDGQATAQGPDTWTLESAATPGVRFNGALCRRIEESTVQSPVDIRVNTVQAR